MTSKMTKNNNSGKTLKQELTEAFKETVDWVFDDDKWEVPDDVFDLMEILEDNIQSWGGDGDDYNREKLLMLGALSQDKESTVYKDDWYADWDSIYEYVKERYEERSRVE